MATRRSRVPIGILLSVVLIASVLGGSAVASAAGTFVDDDGNTHEANIEAIAAAGITKGCDASGTRYCPSDPVTRGQMASFLARAFTLPSTSKDYFPDDNGSTHEANINKIAAAGITLGLPDGTYGPGGLVTRAQMGSYIARALKLAPVAGDRFLDVSGTHEPNINAIAQAGVTLGCTSDGKYYCPADNVRRDQMASFLSRSLKLQPSPTSWQEAVEQVIAEAGKTPPPPTEKDTESTEDGRDSKYRWVLEKHDVVDNKLELANLGVNDDVLWPGALIRGDTAYDFLYQPINAYRAPATLWVDLDTVACSGKIVQVVDDPKPSTVKDGIRQLLQRARDNCGHVPAKAQWDYQAMYSKSQMDLFANADVSYGPVDLSAQFNWSSTSESTRIMAKYQQIYFNVYVDPTTSPAKVFDQARMDPEDIAKILPPGSQPLMVNRVGYGFQALMFLQSRYSEESVAFAMQAAYDKAGTSVDVETGLTADKIMQDTTIKIIVYGGSTAGLGNVYNGYDGFKQVVSASMQAGTDSPGVPLIYQFRHLSDWSNALITFTSQYAIKRQFPLNPKIRIWLDYIEATMVDDEGSDNTVDMDRFSVEVTAVDKQTLADPGTPAIHFPNGTTDNRYVVQWATSGEYAMNKDTRWPSSQHQHAPGTFGGPGTYYLDVQYNNGYDPTTDPTEPGLWRHAVLTLKGAGRDYDGGWSDDEWGYGQMTVYGTDIVGAGGIKTHQFEISCSDFRMTIYVTVELLPPS